MIRRFGWCLLGLGLCGCPNPQTYSTPRTLDKGKSSHAVVLEAYDLRTEEETARSPNAPTYVFRHGMTDGVELGIRAVNLSSLGLDLKLELLRSDVDIAVDPGVQFAFLTLDEEETEFYLVDLPLLVGFNIAPEFTLVAGGGVAAMDGAAADIDVMESLTAERWFARGSIGLDLRLNRRFAVHPALTYFRGLESGNGHAAVFGCALRFGGPTYEGLSL